MDTKLTLTFYDIVSHLFPGAALLLSFRYFSGFGEDISPGETLIYLLVFGYLTGLILHLLGLLLFKPFYPRDYRGRNLKSLLVKWCDFIVLKMPLLRVKSVNPEIKAELTKVLKKKLNLNLEDNRLGLFSIADTYIASAPFAERDILSAKEGVFRSFTVLVIVEMFYLAFIVFPTYNLPILLGGLFLTEICRYGREYYRTIKNQQIYTLTLIKLKND